MSDAGGHYKWIALSNTTLAMLLYAFNQTVMLVALPSIFSGLHADPLSRTGARSVLWLISGYTIATTVLMASFGRIADIHGRVRFYNIGFLIFALGAALCALTPSDGSAGIMELVTFRLVQGAGGAMLAATSIAILTDAFPATQRGLAFAMNQLAFVGGNVLGVVLGGLLAAAHWRLVFVVSVPLGIAGALWSHRQLKDTSIRVAEPPDWVGNGVFGGAMLLIMLGLTYSIVPYGGSSLGWGNPLVVGSLVVGLTLLALFPLIEARVAYPMFNLSLLRVRAFTMANAANFLFSISRGGLQFILIIWLQAVWLPLHGVSLKDIPLQAGLDLLPLMAGFLLTAPASGWLADRIGARLLSTTGLLVIATSFGLLATLPANFDLPIFATFLFINGVGMGLFAAPNSAQLMGSIAPQYRGIAAGMRQTIGNAGQLLSTSFFFTVLIGGLSATLPATLRSGLINAGVPAQAAHSAAQVPPGTALFSSILGYNPAKRLLAGHSGEISPAVLERVGNGDFFARLMAQPLASSMHIAFSAAAAVAVAGAALSALRGPRVVPATAAVEAS
jgi:MFS family permease